MSVISRSSTVVETGMNPSFRVRTTRGAEANCTNSSLLMKLNPASARVAGASSTFTKRTPDTPSRAAMMRRVNSPSPDQPDVSSSTSMMVPPANGQWSK